jgi:hypothetical protein
MIYAASPLSEQTKPARITAAVLAGTVLLSVGFAGREYLSDLSGLLRTEKWKPMRLHREAQTLRDRIGGGGPVLTLGPTEALAAGLDIYPSLSTGPFAFRVAPFIEKNKRRRLGIMGEGDLEEQLRARPPGGVLLGYEPDFEAPLEDAARALGHREETLNPKRRLWLPR